MHGWWVAAFLLELAQIKTDLRNNDLGRLLAILSQLLTLVNSILVDVDYLWVQCLLAQILCLDQIPSCFFLSEVDFDRSEYLASNISFIYSSLWRTATVLFLEMMVAEQLLTRIEIRVPLFCKGICLRTLASTVIKSCSDLSSLCRCLWHSLLDILRSRKQLWIDVPYDILLKSFAPLNIAAILLSTPISHVISGA